MECQLKLRGDVSPKPSYKEGLGETYAHKFDCLIIYDILYQ